MTTVDRIVAIIGNHYRSGPTWDQDAAEEIAALLPSPEQVVVEREYAVERAARWLWENIDGDPDGWDDHAQSLLTALGVTIPDPQDGERGCPECDGRGTKVHDTLPNKSMVCPRCHGTGVASGKGES